MSLRSENEGKPIQDFAHVNIHVSHGCLVIGSSRTVTNNCKLDGTFSSYITSTSAVHTVEGSNLCNSNTVVILLHSVWEKVIRAYG